jgi:hypothetical protein
MAVLCGMIIFAIASTIYANYLDLGREYVEMKYDVYDSRYSSFIAAQLSTIIINAPQALIGLIGIIILTMLKVSEFCD